MLSLAFALAGCGPGFEEEFAPPPGEVNPSASQSQALGGMPACGTALVTWQGTAAYSNGPDTGTGNSCAGTGSYGLQYQCVELVMRHFKKNWGLRWYANAKDILAGAPTATVDVFNNGDLAHPPVPGDMVVWPNGTWGHVALVVAVRSNAVDIIEQNVSGDGRATLPFSNGRIGARWTTWTPSGWAHAKANVGSVPDAGLADAGTEPDAGAEPDAGVEPDAGAVEPDAGAVEPDAGALEPVDAGQPPVGSGVPAGPSPSTGDGALAEVQGGCSATGLSWMPPLILAALALLVRRKKSLA